METSRRSNPMKSVFRDISFDVKAYQTMAFVCLIGTTARTVNGRPRLRCPRFGLPIRGGEEYNESMARGWESKSVEAQIDMAEANRPFTQQQTAPSPESLELLRKKETILLSRTRVVRELDNAQNPRYKVLLKKALADLDAKLTMIAAV